MPQLRLDQRLQLTPDTLEAELLRLEQAFWKARDGSPYRAHMSDLGACLLPVGKLDTRATIAAIEQAEPWASSELEDVVVWRLSDDAAVLHYRVTASREDTPGYRALVATTYVRDEGQWKMLLHQQTPLG